MTLADLTLAVLAKGATRFGLSSTRLHLSAARARCSMCLDQAKVPENLARCHVLSVVKAMCLDQAKGPESLASCHVLDNNTGLCQDRSLENLASCVLENSILARVDLRYTPGYHLAGILLYELFCILPSLHLGELPIVDDRSVQLLSTC